MDDMEWSRVSQQPTIFKTVCAFEKSFCREVFDLEEISSNIDGCQGEDFNFFPPSQFDHPRDDAVNSNRLPRGSRGIAGGELAVLMGATFKSLAKVTFFDLLLDFRS